MAKKEQKKYPGKFIATRSFNDKKVIASGKDPDKVISQARQMCNEPVIYFVPNKNSILVY